MSVNNRPFLMPNEIPTGRDVDVFLFGPFWPFANGKRGPVELVMMTLSKADLDTHAPLWGLEILQGNDQLSSAIASHGRPWSLKICGEGWIRIEQQLGKDVLAWPGHPVVLYRARGVTSSKKAVDYIGVRPLTRAQRSARYRGLE